MDKTCGTCAFYSKIGINSFCHKGEILAPSEKDACGTWSLLDLSIDMETMAHAHGMWAGMRPQWMTVKDRNSGFEIRVHTEAGRSQHQIRTAAVAALEMLVEDLRPGQQRHN